MPEEEQAGAWDKAVENAEAEGRTVTGRDVEEVVVEILPPKRRELTRKEKERIENLPPSTGLWQAERAVRELDRIAENDTERAAAFANVKGWIQDHEA